MPRNKNKAAAAPAGLSAQALADAAAAGTDASPPGGDNDATAAVLVENVSAAAAAAADSQPAAAAATDAQSSSADARPCSPAAGALEPPTSAGAGADGGQTVDGATAPDAAKGKEKEKEKDGDKKVPVADDGEALFLKRSQGAYRPAREDEIAQAGGSDATTKECDYCFETIPIKAVRCKHCQATLSKKSTEESDYFVVNREEGHIEQAGFKETYTKVTLKIKDQTMLATLRCYLGDKPELYDNDPEIAADDLFQILNQLKQNSSGYLKKEDDPLFPLVSWLTQEFEEQSKKFEALKAEGKVTFEFLRYLFTRNSKFFATIDSSHRVGSSVLDTSYVKTMLSTNFVVEGEVIKSKGDAFFTQNHKFVISAFKGTKKVSELNLQPMDEASDAYIALRERGRVFSKWAVGVHHLDYEGPLIYRTTHYKTSHKADGRCMIDAISFNKTNPAYEEFVGGDTSGRSPFKRGRGRADEAEGIPHVPEETLFKCWHTVAGFSFRTKKWGELLIDRLSEIRFEDSAFERMVLPADKKKLIRSLILNTDTSFADIVSGKGSGCIFLLHGPPGVGKTLTAEAVAELLHRPLYSVSVGELGTNTESLEQALRDILDVASVWNAVVLLDEADIFLEKRMDADIHRNAMVGIFLRLLEYHQGVLFLTTNRVKRFDDAFHSRISVALKYSELDEHARLQVWENLLDAAKLDKSYGRHLAHYGLNGRQIRTTIRLAQAMAKADARELRLSDFLDTIAVSEQFMRDLSTEHDDAATTLVTSLRASVDALRTSTAAAAVAAASAGPAPVAAPASAGPAPAAAPAPVSAPVAAAPAAATRSAPAMPAPPPSLVSQAGAVAGLIAAGALMASLIMRR